MPPEVHLPSNSDFCVVQLFSKETSSRARSLAGLLRSTLVEQIAALAAANGDAMEVPFIRL